ncbi:MAG: hypothetical protein HZA53_04765 [Planctomycetes bacterium]|nr:hypothetical protein [Planctomycetota bacterium]
MFQTLLAASFAAFPCAQDPSAAPRPTADGPARLEQLEKRLADLERQHSTEVEELRAELERLEQEAARARSKPPPQSASVFNPGITVFGNFLARTDDRPVFVDDDPSAERVDDRFLLREFELDFRAAIDPWADGVLIAAFGAETPGDFSAEVEEGYVLLKKLPLLDTAPAGLKLKVGRFRPALGRLNTIHLHDLPQPSYPRAVQTMLGAEGFVADGVAGQFFLPSPGADDVLEAHLALLDGGNLPIAGGQSASQLGKLARVQWFRDLAPGKDLAVGVSAWTSDTDHALYGLDATYRWKPAVAGEWRSFLVGLEAFQAELDDPALASSPAAFDVWSQVQLERNLYLGGRFDRAEDLADERLVTHTLGLYLTYYTTEFLRFRVGYEHTESDLDHLDGLDTGLFELNFVYGSHPTEPYWVNR